MTPLEDLPTPAVLIDLDVVERNIGAMQERARRAGVKLRPHAKTHKSPEIARLQLAAGASGLTLAKTSEAEVFASLGFDDIFLAYPIFGADKARRPPRPRRPDPPPRRGRQRRRAQRAWAMSFHAAGRRLSVVLKIDSGAHRVGVAPEAAVETARRIAALPGIAFTGLFTYGGQGYAARTPEEAARAASGEGRTVAEAAAAVAAAGLPVEEVSLGSTPTVRASMTEAGVTECRPGTYVYNDFSQVSLGSARLDECAMTVLATVVSVPARDRAVVDAGSKTLSTDPLRPTAGGHGLVLGRRSRIARLSEEHGVIGVAEGESFRIGERVRILPNHACVVSNLHDRLVAVRSDRVEGPITVAARGCVQ